MSYTPPGKPTGGKFSMVNLLPRRPSTSPEARQTRSATGSPPPVRPTLFRGLLSTALGGLGAGESEVERRGGRSLSAAAADPTSSLLLGDYMMAPWVERIAWWERMRTDGGGGQRGGGNGGGGFVGGSSCVGGGAGSSSNGGSPALGLLGDCAPTPATVWANLSACAPTHRNARRRRRGSPDYISGKNCCCHLSCFSSPKPTQKHPSRHPSTFLLRLLLLLYLLFIVRGGPRRMNC